MATQSATPTNSTTFYYDLDLWPSKSRDVQSHIWVSVQTCVKSYQNTLNDNDWSLWVYKVIFIFLNCNLDLWLENQFFFLMCANLIWWRYNTWFSFHHIHNISDTCSDTSTDTCTHRTDRTTAAFSYCNPLELQLLQEYLPQWQYQPSPFSWSLCVRNTESSAGNGYQSPQGR